MNTRDFLSNTEIQEIECIKEKILTALDSILRDTFKKNCYFPRSSGEYTAKFLKNAYIAAQKGDSSALQSNLNWFNECPTKYILGMADLIFSAGEGDEMSKKVLEWYLKEPELQKTVDNQIYAVNASRATGIPR